MKKRWIALLALLALLLTCCGQSATPAGTAPSQTATGTEDGPRPAAEGFCAGIGRADITPEAGVPLAGYGNEEKRLSATVLDHLYATCVAVRDEAGTTLLMFNFDLINLREDVQGQIRKQVTRATGVEGENIFTNCTHTHSGPAPEIESPAVSAWKAKLYKGAAAAATDALADLGTCTISVGTTETDRLNFVRRYFKTDGFATDHSDRGTGDIISHETEIDREMRLIRFTREGQKDIVLANWQCHPHRTGGTNLFNVSADIIGAWRKEAEKSGEIMFAYFQGGAGNVNPRSRLSEENPDFADYKDYGKALNKHMTDALENMKEMAPGKVQIATATITAPHNHAGEEKLEACKEIVRLSGAGDQIEAEKLCAKNDVESVFEASAIVSHSNLGETGEIPLACYAIGDIAITAAPFEMFCQTERQTRADSPFAFTFSCGYSNSSLGYMPASECFANRGYEVDVTRYAAGTAEQIAARQQELLVELAANK